MAFKFIINKLSIIIFSNYLSGIITTYKQHTMTLTLYYIARHISLQLVYYMLDIFIFHKFTVRYYSWCPFVVETGILD